MKKILLCTLLTLLTALSYGQGKDSLGFFRRLDRKIYEKKLAKVDPEYIGIPETRWAVGTATDAHLNHLYIDQHRNGAGYSGTLYTSPEFVQKLGFSWRGMGLSVPIFNPKWVTPKQKNKNVDYSFSNFGNINGFSATLRISDSHKGTLESLAGNKMEVAEGKCHDRSIDLDFYHVFNGRRFSMPAAFGFTQIQKKSAGSAILTVALRNGKTTVGPGPGPDNHGMSIISNMLAIGGGYGYNYVTERGWLIHFAATGNIVVLKNYDMMIGDGIVEDFGAFPDVVLGSQFAVIRNNANLYYGMNVINRSSLCGSKSSIAFFNSRGNVLAVFGVRF